MAERIVLIGGGISGLCTALALGKAGLKVSVLERDGEPPEGDADRAFFDWARRGASQFRHPHAFLGLMCNLLAERYPDLLEDFYAAGARRVDYADMLSAELESKYRPAPGDDRLWVLMCRRATMETVLRRYVGRMPNIEILNGAIVDGLTTARSDEGLVVSGVRLRRDCVAEFGERISADVVVDACGRTTKCPAWLRAEGVDIPEEVHDAEIVYYTRHYRLKPGQEEPPRNGRDRPGGDLGYIKFGVFPADNGHFAVIVCLHNCEKELRAAIKDGEKFDQICRSIPGLEPWVNEHKAEATTEPFGIGDIRSVWRSFLTDDQPLVRGYFAVGDAAVRTNPLYGRGCSTGILHAHILADVLTSCDDPSERVREFEARTEAELRPIFEASWREDVNGVRRSLASHRGETLEPAPDSFRKRLGVAFGDALAAAARYNLHVNRGMMRTVNLLEKPGAFLADAKTRAIIALYMLRGRRRNASARMQRGPTRTEMLDRLQAAP